MITDNEVHLLQRFATAGDAEAFAQLTQLYAGMVYGTCLRVTGNPEEAADAAQDTFFQLLKNARRVSGSVGGWLHQVATRRAIDLVRRNNSRRQREQLYAAGGSEETDNWSEIAPLVDEALSGLDEPQRGLLIAHYLQGQTTVEMAAAEGVAQSTISRHLDQALSELREKLRSKGVLVGLAALSAGLSEAAQGAPSAVLAELGKMAITEAAASATPAASAGVKLKLAAAAGIAALGLGGYLAYKNLDPDQAQPGNATASASAAQASQVQTATAGNRPETTLPEQNAGARQGFAGRPMGAAGAAPPRRVAVGQGGFGAAAPRGQAMGFGGFASRASVPTPATPRGALQRFATELGRGNMSQLEQSFAAGSAEFTRLQRLLQNPQTDEERAKQQCLQSLGEPVEILEMLPEEEGLRVKWKATVRKPFSLSENGKLQNWKFGDKFELEARLVKDGENWRLAGF